MLYFAIGACVVVIVYFWGMNGFRMELTDMFRPYVPDEKYKESNLSIIDGRVIMGRIAMIVSVIVIIGISFSVYKIYQLPKTEARTLVEEVILPNTSSIQPAGEPLVKVNQKVAKGDQIIRQKYHVTKSTSLSSDTMSWLIFDDRNEQYDEYDVYIPER